MPKDPNQLTLREAMTELAAGRLTSLALTESCLARISAREAEVGAWEYQNPALARAQARARDREPRRGPLHGIPVGVKDIMDTADMPTAYGSPIYRHYRPRIDAECVARLKRAGAVILGKTVTTEFAFYAPGKTRNPRNLAHTPGGSSSGSAAAVADFMAPVALGTQTAGSVIRPAAFCGVVGYKATYGAFDMSGIKPLAPSLDTLGCLTRSAGDAAIWRAAMTGTTGTVRPDAAPRIGFVRTPMWQAATPSVQACLDRVAAALAAAGAAVREIDLGHPCADLTEAQKTIMAAEAARAFVPELRDHAALMSGPLREFIARGAAIPPAVEAAARAAAVNCRRSFVDLFREVDTLLVPSAPGEAPAGTAATGDPVFNRMWTLLGFPCVNLPAGEGPSGLPLGVQLVGAMEDDDRLLAVASWAERHLAAETASVALTGS